MSQMQETFSIVSENLKNVSSLSILLSNRQSYLYERLKESITFFSQPFQKQCILVPNPEIKSWLQMQLANDFSNKVAMGFEFLFPPSCFSTLSFLDFLIKGCFSVQSQDTDYFDLAYQTAQEIAMKYWYGFDPKNASEIETTQVQKKKEIVLQLEAKIEKKLVDVGSMNIQALHVFGFSTFCPEYFTILQDLATKFPVHLWLLSPCMLFWTDICSDFEAHSIEKRAFQKNISFAEQRKLSDLVFDRNRLLANAGRLGRDFARMIEDASISYEEAYIPPRFALKDPNYREHIRPDVIVEDFEREDTSSFLKFVQTDLLLLTGKREQKIDISSCDRSMQVHSSYTVLQEIKVLYEELEKWAHSENKVLQPGQILVLAPDIDIYFSAIVRIFGQKESQFSYQVLDDKIGRSKNLTSAFLNLLDLRRSRMNVEALFLLFQTPAFFRKLKLQPEDLSLLYSWMIHSDFRWGFDAKNRQELLQEEGFSVQKFQETGTWEAFSEEVLASWLEKGMDVSTSNVLGRCITVIQSLYLDLEECQKERSLFDWAQFLRCFLSAYFQPDYDSSHEKLEYEIIVEAIDLLSRSNSDDDKNKETVIAFSTVRKLLECSLEEVQKRRNVTVQSTVLFATIGTVGTRERDAICLIGMNEHAFPRKQERHLQTKLLLQHGYLCSDRFSLRDLDSYFFIESLLLARKLFFLSYQGYSFEERTVTPPSAIILEFLQTLDDGYVVEKQLPSKKIAQVHNLYSSTLSPCRKATSFQSNNFLKRDSSAILFYTLQELLQVAKSPLKPFFQNNLGLYLSSWEEARLSTEETGLDRLEYWKLRKEAFKKTEEQFEPFLQSLQKRDGVHGKVQALSLKEELKELQDACLSFGIKPDATLTIELASSCKTVQEILPNEWHMPPLAFELDGQTVLLEGRLENIHQDGIIFFSNKNTSHIVRQWPEILLRAYVLKQLALPFKNDVYFLKNGKTLPLVIDNPVFELRKYVAFCLRCQEKPCCLFPDGIEHLLKENSDKFLNLMQFQNQDPYISYYVKSTPLMQVQEEIIEWQKMAKELFYDFLLKQKEEKAALD